MSAHSFFVNSKTYFLFFQLEQNLVVQDQSDSAPYYTEIKSMTRKSTSMESIPQNIPESKPSRPIASVHNKFGTVSGASVQSRPSVLNESSPEPNTNRFRAVNRSFRTAVDKSLDVPVEKSGKFNFKMGTKKSLTIFCQSLQTITLKKDMLKK